MQRPKNNRAWWLVTPMLVLVAVSAVVPLMTVVNYSVQDTFGNNRFFWAGVQWYRQVLQSDYGALPPRLLGPIRPSSSLGVFIASDARAASGCGVPLCGLARSRAGNVVGRFWCSAAQDGLRPRALPAWRGYN